MPTMSKSRACMKARTSVHDVLLSKEASGSATSLAENDSRNTHSTARGILLTDIDIPHPTGHGSAFQMPVAYSAMVRSLENFPDAAMFKIALRCQACASPYRA